MMASDDDRKKAGAAKRRKRWVVTGLLVLIYLVFYVSSYLLVRSKAWIQPHPLVYSEDYSGPGLQLQYSVNTISPSDPYFWQMATLADGFYMPLIWAEWVCWKREVYFDWKSVDYSMTPAF